MHVCLQEWDVDELLQQRERFDRVLESHATFNRVEPRVVNTQNERLMKRTTQRMELFAALLVLFLCILARRCQLPGTANRRTEVACTDEASMTLSDH